jgi:hypothetical protein
MRAAAMENRSDSRKTRFKKFENALAVHRHWLLAASCPTASPSL